MPPRTLRENWSRGLLKGTRLLNPSGNSSNASLAGQLACNCRCRCESSETLAIRRPVAMCGLSVAGFVEWLVGRALADAGLVEQPAALAPACTANALSE